MIRYKKMNESSPLEISRSQISGDEILRREQTDIPGLELLETQRIVDDTTCVLFFILDGEPPPGQAWWLLGNLRNCCFF